LPCHSNINNNNNSSSNNINSSSSNINSSNISINSRNSQEQQEMVQDLLLMGQPTVLCRLQHLHHHLHRK
jgi:hypothetical protein